MFQVDHLSYKMPGQPGRFLWRDVGFKVENASNQDFTKSDPSKVQENDENEPEIKPSNRILAIRGASGSGKTTLLKCIAQLIPSDAVPSNKFGSTQSIRSTSSSTPIFCLNNQSPRQIGIPEWRSRVMYVPQRAPIQPGTPNDFVNLISKFSSYNTTSSLRNRKPYSPIELGTSWGLPPDTWDKEWSALSGGEIQRVSLAIALSRDPDVLLLDEPTSALDPHTTLLVEQSISKGHCPIVLWITHNPEQELRVASRSLVLGDATGNGKWYIEDRNNPELDTL